MNEDSEWWTAALADMDAATVRTWCLNRAASGALVDWCWWDGVQTTRGWERARVAFVAFADVLAQRDAAGGGSPTMAIRGKFANRVSGRRERTVSDALVWRRER